MTVKNAVIDNSNFPSGDVFSAPSSPVDAIEQDAGPMSLSSPSRGARGPFILCPLRGLRKLAVNRQDSGRKLSEFWQDFVLILAEQWLTFGRSFFFIFP